MIKPNSGRLPRVAEEVCTARKGVRGIALSRVAFFYFGSLHVHSLSPISTYSLIIFSFDFMYPFHPPCHLPTFSLSALYPAVFSSYFNYWCNLLPSAIPPGRASLKRTPSVVLSSDDPHKPSYWPVLIFLSLIINVMPLQ